MAHWLDVGGTLGQVTTDIYSEGIQIPIVKYQKAGVVNQDLVDIIAMNVRLPERALGDLRAWRDGGAELSPAVGRFLAETEDVPGEALVWLASGAEPRLARGEGGGLVAFA